MGFLKFVPCLSLLLVSASIAALGQTPSIDPVKGIENGASFVQGQPVAPGSYVAIFGSNFASGLTLASTIPLSTSLVNISVAFNGILAPLGGINDTQINAQVPWNVLPAGATNGSAQVVVTRTAGKYGVVSAPATVQISSIAPGLFYVATDNNGVNRPSAFNNSDGTLAYPAGAVAGLTTRPAKVNDPTTLAILATGLGPVTVTPRNGAAATDAGGHFVESDLVDKSLLTVLVGGVPANVIFAGLSQFPSVYQINVILAPNTPTGDAIPLQIQMGGLTTTDQLKIAVTD